MPVDIVTRLFTFRQNPDREGLGGFNERRVVQQSQCRQWWVALRASCRAFFPAGSIKRLHHGMQKLPLPMGVKTAAILVFTRIVFVLAGGKIQMPIIACGLMGFDAVATDVADQQTAYRKRVVANHFSRQPVSRLTRKPPVGGIGAQQFL